MTNDQFQRAGAKLLNGVWICRDCGLPVEGDEAREFHDAPIAYWLSPTEMPDGSTAPAQSEALYCGKRIGKVVDMVALSERRRKWILVKTDESFALPEYLRREAVKSMRLTAKPSIKTVSLWYTEVRECLQHSIETCQKRPPLEKRYEKSLQKGLQRTRWA